MPLVSWDCRINVCTSSRKKEANRAAGDAKVKLAPIQASTSVSGRVAAALPLGIWNRHVLRKRDVHLLRRRLLRGSRRAGTADVSPLRDNGGRRTCPGSGPFLGWANARQVDPRGHRSNDRHPRHRRCTRNAGNGGCDSRQSAPARTTVNARVAEAGFWLFAALGALVARRDSRKQRGSLAPRWGDGVVALLAVLLVRLMVRGIPFVP